MKLNNGIISAEIVNKGAELKSAVKNGYEYMWCGDEKYWARTAPVLFPFVGGLKNKCYKYEGKSYPMGQHGFARDCEFVLKESSSDSATFVLSSTEETYEKYPFEFIFTVKYTLLENTIKIDWMVENKNDKIMYFSIGGHPGFNLKEGDNYFKFDTDGDLTYNLIDETGFFDKNNVHTLENNGLVKIYHEMFDNDALMFENGQIKEVALCGSDKEPYLKVKFDTEIVGLWAPVKKKAPFLCIEPWYGRCDSNDFNGEISEKDHILSLEAGKTFTASYEIELL